MAAPPFPPPPGAWGPPTNAGDDALFGNMQNAAPHQSNPLASQPTNPAAYERFSFRSMYGRLELRSLLREDVERIKSQVDVQALTKHVENLAFSDVRVDDMRHIGDNEFVKVRTAQAHPGVCRPNTVCRCYVPCVISDLFFKGTQNLLMHALMVFADACADGIR